jgi:hypothetical protein
MNGLYNEKEWFSQRTALSQTVFPLGSSGALSTEASRGHQRPERLTSHQRREGKSSSSNGSLKGKKYNVEDLELDIPVPGYQVLRIRIRSFSEAVSGSGSGSKWKAGSGYVKSEKVEAFGALVGSNL